MKEFNEGDTVRLKSGGPIMTIDQIGTAGSPGNAVCSWFDGNKRQKEIFSLKSLEHVSPSNTK